MQIESYCFRVENNRRIWRRTLLSKESETNARKPRANKNLSRLNSRNQTQSAMIAGVCFHQGQLILIIQYYTLLNNFRYFLLPFVESLPQAVSINTSYICHLLKAEETISYKVWCTWRSLWNTWKGALVSLHVIRGNFIY